MAIIDEKANIVQSYEYSSFGECLSGKDAVNSFRFVGGFGGQTDDDTGLVYFWNRWYDPQVGRWVSEDPIRQRGGGNLFKYAANDPVSLVDLNGLRWEFNWVESHLNHYDRKTGALIGSWDAVSGGGASANAPSGKYEIGEPTTLDVSTKENRRKNKAFMDPSGFAWWAPIYPLFETDRTSLGIHPDGNVPGVTNGCIGAGAKDTRDLYNDLVHSYNIGDTSLTVR